MPDRNDARRLGSDDDTVSWYALLVQPQREDRVIEVLAQHGVYGFYPVEKKWKVGRIKRPVAGMKSMPDGRHGYWHERKILGGYVFAKFTGTPRWHLVMALPNILRVLGRGGEPIRLSFKDLRTLHELRQRVRDIETAKEQSSRIAFKVGDRVKITEAGAFDGFVQEIESVDVSNETAYIRDLLLLGKPVPMRFSQLSHM